MLLAGPVEFSLADLIGALLVAVVVFVGVPIGGGLLALRFYRRDRSPEQRTDLGTVGSFLLGAVVASVVFGFVAWLSEQLVP